MQYDRGQDSKTLLFLLVTESNHIKLHHLTTSNLSRPQKARRSFISIHGSTTRGHIAGHICTTNSFPWTRLCVATAIHIWLYYIKLKPHIRDPTYRLSLTFAVKHTSMEDFYYYFCVRDKSSLFWQNASQKVQQVHHKQLQPLDFSAFVSYIYKYNSYLCI